jgi:uncharacterized Fe-S cluster-containing radical SAM superfamily protein
MSRTHIAERIKHYHDLLVKKTENSPNRYLILRDYSGTYIQKQMESEERMVDPIFRVFDAVKPERGRKLNVNPIYEFSVHNDSLFDYGSIIGHKLRKPWHMFNRLIAIHIPLCPNDCWHCYVPKELYVTDQLSKHHIALTAREIVDLFKKQQDLDQNQKKDSNVLRITGGEPFLVPELIFEILQTIQKDRLSDKIFVWTETNLESFVGPEGQAFMDQPDNKAILNELKNFSNFCVHPCFHGLSKEEFNLITGKDYSINLEDQIAALRRLVMAEIDVYPTFGTNVCDPSNIRLLYEGLKSISPNLPLKVALVKYDFENYPPVASRVAPKTERIPLIFSRFAALRIWNQLLMRDYGIGYAVFPRHLVTYGPPISSINEAVPSGGIAKEAEIVYFFKSSYRDLYHREILDLLAFPSNHIFEITYDKERVQDDLFFHMGRVPEQYKGRKCLWFYVDRYSSSLLPLRYGEIVEVKNSTGVLTVKLKLNDYLTFSNGGKDLKGKIRTALSEYFGSGTVPPGGKYMLLGEDFTTTIPTPASAGETCISSAFGLKEKPILSGDSSYFRKVVDQLNEFQDMKRSLFYRLTLIGLEKDEELEKTGKTLYTIKGGKSFKIVVDYYQPNYQQFDEKQPQQRTIVFESSSPKIQIVGSPRLVFSKYGSGELFFRTESVVPVEEIAINIHSPYDDFRAASITLNIKLEPTHWGNALRSLLAAILLAVGTTGFTMLAKTVEKKASIWTMVGDLYEQFVTLPTVILVVLLTLCFYGVFFFKSSGIPVKP